MSAQLAMPLRAPARDRRERIRAETLRVLEERGEAWILKAALADRVCYRLGLDGLAAETRQRRIKEAIRELRIRRVLIASCVLGYRLDPERKTSRGRRIAQIRSMAETFRSEDAALADSLNRWLDEVAP